MENLKFFSFISIICICLEYNQARTFELSEDENQNLHKIKEDYKIGNKMFTEMKDLLTRDWSSDDIYTRTMKDMIWLQGKCKQNLGEYYNATSGKCSLCSTCSDLNLCRSLCNEYLINQESREDETKSAKLLLATFIVPLLLLISSLCSLYLIHHKMNGISKGTTNQQPDDDME